MEPLLKRDLPPELPRGMGVVVGVVKHGERRVFAYGTAHPDSIYQIGSITKTFTGLLLAQMVVEGKVRLDQPLRELLPAGTVRKPDGREITLLDLATHRSGLPPMPEDFNPRRFATAAAGYAGYHAADLYAYVARRGVAREADPPFVYSNLGFSLLGEALRAQTGISYPDMIAQRITGPLGMCDTVRPDLRRAPGTPDSGIRRPAPAVGTVGPGRIRPGRRHQLHGRRHTDVSGSAATRRFARAPALPGTACR